MPYKSKEYNNISLNNYYMNTKVIIKNTNMNNY